MRDHDFRIRRSLLAPVAIMQISNQSPCRATDVKEIHRVRADAREFGPLISVRIATLRFRYNSSNRASANTACPKRKRLVKAVIQFRPFAGVDEFVDSAQI